MVELPVRCLSRSLGNFGGLCTVAMEPVMKSLGLTGTPATTPIAGALGRATPAFMHALHSDLNLYGNSQSWFVKKDFAVPLEGVVISAIHSRP